MSILDWRMSSYCQESSNCLNVAAASGGAVRLRESEEPAVVVTTTADRLGVFIRAAKAGAFDHLAR